MKSPTDPLFKLSRAILFKMDPERAHALALRCLDTAIAKRINRSRCIDDCPAYQCLGLEFPNRVGLAAGMDKNGDYIDALGAMGFGFIEIGTTTPKPQPGNDKPRLFRLKAHEALINRMGFNNKGVDYLVSRVERRKYKGIIGINIGKNKSTPMDQAVEDYLHCLEKVYPVADYVTVNVSSPNTRGLRDLQHGAMLNQLLDAIKNAQSNLHTKHHRYVPVAVKIAPDMSSTEIEEFCSSLEQHDLDAVIIGNTTQERDVVSSSPHAGESGGLSGAPLYTQSNKKLAEVANCLQERKTIIGVGGISAGDQAASKIGLGAHLVQLYSGLIYQGPGLVADCVSQLQALQPANTNN